MISYCSVKECVGVIKEFIVTVPPPSYDSLFGRVREVHRTSGSVADFVKNIVILFLGTSEYILSFFHYGTKVSCDFVINVRSYFFVDKICLQKIDSYDAVVTISFLKCT